jgi:hypothetical protein
MKFYREGQKIIYSEEDGAVWRDKVEILPTINAAKRKSRELQKEGHKYVARGAYVKP